MPRYINEEEFVAWVKEHWCSDCNNDNGLRCRACWIDDAIDIVEEAPPADVVPKSEVERLREINSLLTEAGQEWQKRYENLAREIFEEINGVTELFAKGLIGELEMYDQLSELKKKYTENI